MARFIASWTSRGIVANLLILVSGWFDPGTGLDELQPFREDRQPDTVTNTEPFKKLPSRRMRLLAENPYCTYCGCRLFQSTATLDHVWPKSKGGLGVAENLTLSCSGCNGDKGSNTLKAWRKELINRLEILQRVHRKDGIYELCIRREYLQRIISKLDIIIDVEVGSVSPSLVTVQPPSNLAVPDPSAQDSRYPKRKPGRLVQREDFILGPCHFAILDGATGELLISDTNIKEVSDFLLSDGDNLEKPIRLIRYQEMFNPNWKMPDWRSYRSQRYDEYLASKVNPSADIPESDRDKAIAVPVDA